MSNYSMADIGSLMGASNVNTPTNSTSRANNTDLTMQDFLQLMVVQLQNQTMDDTMDTSDMMNQMVQMQMVTAISNLNELSVMTYASSLVGKVVTIGIVNGNNLEEREIEVIGTGMLNGEQVIFGSDGETYALNQIMAVGRLPEIEGVEKPGEGTDGNNGSVTPTNPLDPDGTKEPETGDTVDKPVTPPTDGEDKTEGNGGEDKDPVVESPELSESAE